MHNGCLMLLLLTQATIQEKMNIFVQTDAILRTTEDHTLLNKMWIPRSRHTIINTNDKEETGKSWMERGDWVTVVWTLNGEEETGKSWIERGDLGHCCLNFEWWRGDRNILNRKGWFGSLLSELWWRGDRKISNRKGWLGHCCLNLELWMVKRRQENL